jgi:hypothetical protein
MRLKNATVAAMCAALILGTWALLSAQGPTQLPLEPVRERGQSVTPAYEGWYKNPDGTFTLLVGYFNRNRAETLEIPVGPNNRIEPGGPDQGQPTHFLTRRNWGVFTIVVPADFGTRQLTWTLVSNGETIAIPLSLNPSYEVQPFKDPAMGNLPPVLRFQESGPELTGPPQGIAASYTARAGRPTPLSFWASDDSEQRQPESGSQAAGRGRAAAVTVFLSKYRGPGEVTFDNPRPRVDDGLARVSATFDAPGEYIVRVQANDSTGDGGGGFQCCWTNAHVRVTVTP